ncbi:MAG: transporter substrate-binding domain-containing protein [Promethearchaeota archaeon]|nr:MAG: transporter substrate-binding domain-containing protein [Candidatus Lokiarchaeota archaeon]
MKREFAVLGMIICLGAGLGIGWFIPGLFTPAAQPSLLDQIESRGYFLVGTSADYPPFENKTYPEGEIIGFDINISLLIANEIGVPLQMVDMDFDSLIGACGAGQIDMIAAAMTYNPTRAQELAASVTYFTVSQIVVVRNDSVAFPNPISNLDDLSGYEVGCQSGTVMQTELEGVSGVTVAPYARADLMMQDLVNGLIDAVYIDGPILDASPDKEDLKIIYSSGEEPLALWTQLDEPELLYVINDVIFDAYQTGVYADLVNYWFGNVTTS